MIEAAGGFVCKDSMFLHNTAGKDSAIVVVKADWFLIRNSIFLNNEGAQGAAINMISTSNGTIEHTTFKNNTSSNVNAVKDLYLKVYEGMFLEDLAFHARDINHTIHGSSTCDGKDRTYVNADYIVMENVTAAMSECGMFSNYQIKDKTYVKDISLHCLHHEPDATFSNDTEIYPDVSKDRFLVDGPLKVRCRSCPPNQYIVQGAVYTLGSPSMGLSNYEGGQCNECPVGAICDNDRINAQPNYWGLIHDAQVSFEFCQPYYCCQKSPCHGFDDCNTGK